MIDITYSCPGLSKLEEGLKSLPDKLAKKHLMASLKKGLQIVQRAEQKAVSHRTGKLSESISIYTRTRNKMPGAVIEVGVKPLARKLKAWGKPTNLASLVEFGTQPHTIPKEGKKVNPKMSVHFSGNWYSHVHHPGAKPHPFINPAIDSNIERVIYAVEDELGNRLINEIEGFNI